MSRKISINPSYFKISGKREKKKKKKPSFNDSQNKPNDVKKKLIARIKEHHQLEKERELLDVKRDSGDATFKNEFKDTMDYLEELNKKKKKRKRKKRNKTIKKPNPQSHTRPQHCGVDVHPMGPSWENSTSSSRTPPPYGILKNNTKPTYRQWKKTLKNTSHDNIPVLPEKSITFPNTGGHNTSVDNTSLEVSTSPDFTERKHKLDYIKNKLRGNDPVKRKIKTRRLRRKITLGKSNGKVGVLVKNNKTRKLIKNEVTLLKNKPMREIKEYLRKHNLLRIGSSAPEHICRKTYESAYLSGDIHNKNSGILLHNWNSDDKH